MHTVSGRAVERLRSGLGRPTLAVLRDLREGGPGGLAGGAADQIATEALDGIAGRRWRSAGLRLFGWRVLGTL